MGSTKWFRVGLGHGQSQNFAVPDAGVGARHVRHRDLGITPLLFVREAKHDERGRTSPYVFLGPVDLLSHEGARPISIVWRLAHPMPPQLYQRATLAV